MTDSPIAMALKLLHFLTGSSLYTKRKSGHKTSNIGQSAKMDSIHRPTIIATLNPLLSSALSHTQIAISPRNKEVITLKEGAGLTATVIDIAENPKNIKIQEMEAAQAPAEELEKLGAGSLHRATHEGDVENGSVMIGEISGMLSDIKPVKTIIEDMVNGLPKVITSIEDTCK